MFGLEDPMVSMGYLLCIVTALLCVGYGIKNWNKGNEMENEQIREEINWQIEENEIEDKL